MHSVCTTLKHMIVVHAMTTRVLVHPQVAMHALNVIILNKYKKAASKYDRVLCSTSKFFDEVLD